MQDQLGSPGAKACFGMSSKGKPGLLEQLAPDTDWSFLNELKRELKA
jgi:hypothetical protein